MASFVLDASMAASWHFADELDEANLIIERMTVLGTVVVPRHWFAEIGNTLVMGERKGRATADDSERFLERVRNMIIVVDDLGEHALLDRAVPLARTHKLTVYDALYLELAQREKLPLASLDLALCAAARDVDVVVMNDSL